MRILVTGGTGDVGRTTVARLVEHGHKVRVIGRRAGLSIEGAEYRQCDITDYDTLCKQVEGIEGVVHLAAIRHPGMGPGQEIFRVNCAGTFNVFEAAARQGIKRVVCASSINALGYNFGIKDFPLLYFPIDEEHPTYTTDPYSFSKQIIEEIAAYYWRREGISSACLRFPFVYELSPKAPIPARQVLSLFKKPYEELLALPEAARREHVRQLIEGFERLRQERAWEKPFDLQAMLTPEAGLLFGRSNFWTIIDARDSAQAIEKGLLAEYEGSHPLYINDSHNFVGLPSQDLARVFFPEVKTWKRPLQGDECLVSIDKARKLIGFEPEYSVSRWHDSTPSKDQEKPV